MSIETEGLGLWYLRLNGFLAIPNFVVHPEQGRNQRTDIDVLAVRFPHRAELLEDPMTDDPALVGTHGRRVFLALAEVKRGRCRLNMSWVRPELGNVQRVLSAVGILPREAIESVARGLYEHGVWNDQDRSVAFVCIGESESAGVAERFTGAVQVAWASALRFIFQRFKKYQARKVSHAQWDKTGNELWDQFVRFRKDENAFVSAVKGCLVSEAPAPIRRV